MVAAMAVAVLWATSCGSTPEPVTVTEYLTAWADAWSGGDPYDIVRFYDVEVEVRLAQGDNESTYSAGYRQDTTSGVGAAWLANWIGPQTSPRSRAPVAMAVDADSAVVVTVIDDLGTALWWELALSESGITRQTTLRWRSAHKPSGAPDARLDWLDGLVAEHAAAFDVSIDDITSGNSTAPAVFVTPGSDTTAAGYVGKTGGCTVAMSLSLEDGQITAETARLDPDCAEPPEIQLVVPGPAGTQPNAELRGIELYSSTPEMARLVERGLDAFSRAGLQLPQVDRVRFDPSPDCAGVVGLTSDLADGSRDVLLCVDATTACLPDRDRCETYASGVELALAHELGHVWLLDHADREDREAFLALTGLDTWDDAAVPWHERGVEHAAETLAWGLVEGELELGRIGFPSCRLLATSFELLTGTEPIQDCPAG